MNEFAPLLSQDERKKIIEDAMDILEKIGIECEHKKSLEMLSAVCGVSVSSGRVKLSREILVAYIEKRRAEQPADDPGFGMIGPWCSFEICDPYTNEVRRPVEQDVINASKLIDSITCGTGAFGGPIPLYLPNVPPKLETFRQEVTAVKYTRKLGGKLTALDKTEIDYITAMYKAAGRKYKIALQGLISPLRLNPEVMDAFFEQDGNADIDMEISCAIPMAGATAPVVFPAALVQAVAETIAVDFIFNMLTKHRKFDCLTVRLEPFDMKSTNIVFGSPEWCILNRACVELENELRGVPRRHGVFRSNSRRFDAQSMCERSMSVLYQALNGIRRFGAVGQLCVDEVFSPLQAVMDIQILNYTRRVIGGFNGAWDETVDTVSILQEGIDNGMFLDVDTTVTNFRKFYDMNTLFTYEKLNSWRESNRKNLEESAREELERILSAHPFKLEDSKLAEIDRIAAEGEKYLLGMN
jgi:trimethylamine:corrinoid methyltransferase-like protein